MICKKCLKKKGDPKTMLCPDCSDEQKEEQEISFEDEEEDISFDDDDE